MHKLMYKLIYKSLIYSVNAALKRKQKAWRLETICLSFYFFVEGNNTYVQQNLNMHLKSKT